MIRLRGLGATGLVGLVRRLIGEVERLREENEKLNAVLAAARLEHQQLKDEIGRLKGLPPRPPMKPSGMEKATDRFAAEKPSQADASPPRRRGPGVSKLSIDRTVTLTTSRRRRVRVTRATKPSSFRISRSNPR